VVLTFILYKYFPFGGLQRDFLNIAQACKNLGNKIIVYTMKWEGAKPDGFDIRIWKPNALRAITKNLLFNRYVLEQLQSYRNDIIIGFNKMPGLDIYYAADTCYQARILRTKPFWYKYTSRYKHFLKFEKAVFATGNKTECLLISDSEKILFERHYHTEDLRLHSMPPNIQKNRCRPEESYAIKKRKSFREKYNIGDCDQVLLLIGSSFKTKGLDRALYALSNVSSVISNKVILFVVGDDKPGKFLLLAKYLKIADKVFFFGGRNDVNQFLLGADLLIHPAYNESAGGVLLEAMVSGLPVFCTDICGYSHYIQDACAGQLIPSPFSQKDMNKQLLKILETKETQKQWQKNALAYTHTADFFRMPELAADIIEKCATKTKCKNTKRSGIDEKANVVV